MKFAIARTRVIRDRKTVITSWLSEEFPTEKNAANEIIFLGGSNFGCQQLRKLYDSYDEALEAVMGARILHTPLFVLSCIKAVAVDEQNPKDYPTFTNLELLEQHIKEVEEQNAKN